MIFNKLNVIILEISLTVKLNNSLCATDYLQISVGLTLLKELYLMHGVTGLGWKTLSFYFNSWQRSLYIYIIFILKYRTLASQ